MGDEMRLSTEERKVAVKLVRKGQSKTKVAELFDTSRQTVHKWCKRAFHKGRESFRDEPRKPKQSKITVEVEVSILALRNTFGWGTARIRQGLYKLPEYAREAIDCIQGVRLSRSAINEVLKKHGINGYKRKHKAWKFFRAKEPDELWQIDLKGPFTVQGQKYWFLIVLDDYSRYLILAEKFDHEPTTQEVTELLSKLDRKPKNILTDNGVQFKKKWEKWCKKNGIKPLFAHPYYPQDKGKVERMIRNLNEEFLYLVLKFPEWLNDKITEYRDWYNQHRFHYGIGTMPCELYM